MTTVSLTSTKGVAPGRDKRDYRVFRSPCGLPRDLQRAAPTLALVGAHRAEWLDCDGGLQRNPRRWFPRLRALLTTVAFALAPPPGEGQLSNASWGACVSLLTAPPPFAGPLPAAVSSCNHD